MTSRPSQDAVAPDGRRLRRERNREAVVTALLDIYRAGNIAPGADEIAERAGISVRSLFRYFDDIDDLVRTAVARQQHHLAPLYALEVPDDLPLTERIERFVAARMALLEGMGEVGRAARALAARQPLVLAELARVRGTLRRQLTGLFAAELDARAPADRATAVAAADVVTSWESFDLMRNDQGLSRDAAGAAMVAALTRLLAGGPDAEAGSRSAAGADVVRSR